MTEEEILDLLLNCPHKQIENLIPIHNKIYNINPEFYVKLSIWFQKNKNIINNEELFIAKLFISDNLYYRKVASLLLENISIYEINNIIDYIKGKVILTKQGKIFNNTFNKNVPRILKNTIKNYLKNLEKDNNWINSLSNKDIKILKSIYCRLHICPKNEYIKDILFNKKKRQIIIRKNIINNINIKEKFSSSYYKNKNLVIKEILSINI